MTIKRIIIVVSILALFQVGCSDVAITRNQAEVKDLQKIRSGQYVLIKSDDLGQLRKDAEIGKSVGRYQMRQIGVRTWRLDTATGTSCLLLTTDADWKKPETQAEGCFQ